MLAPLRVLRRRKVVEIFTDARRGLHIIVCVVRDRGRQRRLIRLGLAHNVHLQTRQPRRLHILILCLRIKARLEVRRVIIIVIACLLLAILFTHLPYRVLQVHTVAVQGPKTAAAVSEEGCFGLIQRHHFIQKNRLLLITIIFTETQPDFICRIPRARGKPTTLIGTLGTHLLNILLEVHVGHGAQDVVLAFNNRLLKLKPSLISCSRMIVVR